MRELTILNTLHDMGVCKGRVLAKVVGVDEPTIRAYINRFRSIGIPVCSSRQGYYISEDPQEIQKTIDSMEHRIQLMRNAVNGLRIALEGMEA